MYDGHIYCREYKNLKDYLKVSMSFEEYINKK